MAHLILIDEKALKDCVESSIYQSSQFDAGLNLAKALSGDKGITAISPRVIPVWRKDILFLLQSKVEVGYFLINAEIFGALNDEHVGGVKLEDVLFIFQRICRFGLKVWNKFTFSPSEKWNNTSDCGIIFPYPFSKHSSFRVVVRRGYNIPRVSKRHGLKHLFAFEAGNTEFVSLAKHEVQYTRAFEELSAARMNIEASVKVIEATPTDFGQHPLVLSDPNHSSIKCQTYEQWLPRLTIRQKKFVESNAAEPQRVEGPAGTGKTLSLLLRSYYLCKHAEASNSECRILFVAHSEATREAISLIFDSLGSLNYHRRGRNESLQTIELYTLQQWCGSLLGNREISNAQFLDQDALESKELRKVILRDIVQSHLKGNKSVMSYLSTKCRDFFEGENLDYIAELLQHEIGVLIKGRASEKLESYLELPTLAYCLPTETANDKKFIYGVYRQYQDELNQSNVFDTDDIVLSTLGRLDTPIWRRRREKDGFDYICIDETHLFNFNELAVFHHLLKKPDVPCIIFSIDRSQAPGERGITTKMVREVLMGGSTEDVETKTDVVFRSSSQIVRLAEAITSSGASLFTTFENPLTNVSAVSTASDENMASNPLYWECVNDEHMCEKAIERVKLIANRLKCRAGEVLLVATTDELIHLLREKLTSTSVKLVQLTHRGDLEAVQRGLKDNAWIISHPDFVGGLEFKAVILIGVDEGRIPGTEGVEMMESKHFAAFKACNRLYVAITRARLVAELFYSKERGKSSLLEYAISASALELMIAN